MSVSTHLNTLRQFRQWVRSSQPEDALLERVLTAIQSIDETASALSLYQVKEHQLSLSLTTQENTESSVQVNPTVTPAHSKALTLRKPVYDEQRGVRVIPLDSVHTGYGLLEVVSAKPSMDDDEADMDSALLLIAEAMAQALDLHALERGNGSGDKVKGDSGSPRISSREVSERQTRVFNEMVAGQTLANMATIVARHMLPENDRHLAIHELNYDTHGRAQEWKSLDRDDSRSKRALQISISWDDLSSELRSQVEQGEVVYVGDLKNASVNTIGDRLHRWLSTQNMLSVIVCPISVDGRVVAVLTITSQLKDAFTPEEVNAFRNLADQMGVLSRVRQLLNQARQIRNIVDNVALANRLITVANDYAFMAQGVSYTIGRDMLAVAISLFDSPATETDVPEYRQILGMATRDETIEVDIDLQRVDIPTVDQIARMQTSLPLIFKSLDSRDNYISDETRETYASLGATWMVSFGLRTNNQLLGTMDVLHEMQYDLSQEEIDAFTTLADQIGMNLRSRQLLHESRIAHDMAAQLVETNSQIAIANDYIEMASAVINALPEQIELVGIMLFDEPISSREMPKWLKTEVLAGREQVFTPEIIDYTPADNPIVLRTIKNLIEGEMLLVGDARDLAEGVLPETTAFLVEQGLNSFAAIALRTGARLLGVIAFCAPNIESLNSLQLENLRAIAGQVGIAIENRNLLNQTADALSFVAAQYEMSNAMFRAKTPQDMLSLLFRFSDEVYNRAHVGMIEEDDKKMRIIAQIGLDDGADIEGNTAFVLPVPKEVIETEEHTIVSDDKQRLILPLVTTTNDLVGVVEFFNEEPVEIPFNQLRAIRSLADQMALGLENRVLLEKTDRTLKETRTIYEVSQSVSGAKDSLEVLTNIRETIATGAVALSLVNVEQDIITDTIDGIVLYSLVTDTLSDRIKVKLHERYGEDIIESFRNKWAALDNEVEFAEKLSPEEVQANPITRYLSEQGIKVASAITLPVFSEGVMVQQVHIAFDEPRHFTKTLHRLYLSLRDQVTVVLENHRLLLDIRTSAAQLGNQVRILQSINQLASNLSTAQDEATLLEEASQALVNALGVDHVGIAMLNPGGMSATVIAEYPPQGVIGVHIDESNPLQKEIIATRQPYLVQNVDANTELESAVREQLKAIGIKSMMVFPMVDIKDQFLGSIGLDVYREDFEFTPAIIDVARTIAAQVVISLQNVRQFQNTQRQAEQLQKLSEFSQHLQEQLELDAIVKNIMQDTPQIVASEHINIYRFDAQTSKLNLLSQSINGIVNTGNAVTTPALANTSAEKAWKERTLHIVQNFETTTNLKFTTSDTIKSAMFAPYFSRGVPVGVIEIGHSIPHIYTETDQIIFQQLVNQVGIASENADAYMQSQRIAKSKALVNEISSELQSQLDVSSILDVTVNELGRALGARRGRIRLGTGKNGTEQE